MDSVVAHGTFGVVYQCSSSLNPTRKLACKRVFQDARYKNREMEIVLQLLTNEETGEV
jgi:predicted Ser/Thr protein kinase